MAGRKSLEGIHVVVDGYNLDLPYGTGIKTYGLTLIEALQTLQAQVGVLHARPGVKQSNSDILNSILFVERPDTLHRSGRVRHLTNTAAAVLRCVIGRPCDAVEVKIGEPKYVVPPSEEGLQNYFRYNSRNCYDTATRAFYLAGRDFPLRIPNKVDIWHATYPVPVSLRGAKKITTLHDCIPFRLPYTTLDDKKRLYRLYRHAIRTSDLILTVSENSKADIALLFDVDPEKIEVAYQPVSVQNLSDEERASLAHVLEVRFDLEPDGYILFVGAIEPKKNVKRLIDAYLEIDTDLPLVIVGNKAWLWESQIGHLDSVDALKSGRVQLFGHVPSKDLRYLYAGAHCFVFPSLYEGFGLPPLEAMTFGVPVVTANISSLPEVCGDAALYVDPYDTESIRSGIEKVLADEDVRHRLRVAGKKRVHALSPEVYVKRLYEVYSAIL